MNRTSILCRRSLRAYFAAFITYVMLAGQVAPLALAAPRHTPPARSAAIPSAPPSKAAPRPAPVVFAAPNITATKVDSWDDSATPDGKAEPGQTVTYTVTITNTGDADATGVTFTDSVDTNTTLVPGSTNTQPIAIADSYNVIGNVRIQPNAAQGLLANDRDPDSGNNTGLTASGPSTTAQNGQITINADGSFSYNPAPGFTGTDTVTYTITDGGGKTDTAVATFLVGNGTSTPGTNVVWFVNPSAPAGGDGRLTNPFNCYTGGTASCFSQTAADDPGDIIFLFNGSHTGGNTLLNNQKLVGQGAGATLASIGSLTVPTGSDTLPVTGGNPNTVTMTTVAAATNAVNLGQGNLLRGFTVAATTGAKIFGNNFGTLTAGNTTTPDLALSGAGQALNLTTGAFAASSAFNGVATTSSTTQGITLAGITGTVAFGGTQVTGSTTQGILVGTTTADINFGNTTVTAGTDAVSFQNNSAGTRTFGALTATAGGAGSAFVSGAGGGNVTVTGLATLQSGSGHTIDIQNQGAGSTISFAGGATLTKTAGTNSGVNINTSTGNVTFGGTLTVGTGAARFPTTAVNITGGTGIFSLGTVSIFTNGFTGISTTTDGTLNSTGGTVDTGAGTALNIAGPAGITTLGMTLGTVNSTGGTNNVNVTNADGTLSMTGGALSGASGSSFVVSGSNPTVSFGGTISQTNAARVVDIQGTTGNTVSFGGTITGGASSLGVHIGDTTAVNGNVTFTTLNLGTAAARMTNQAVTITNGGSGATYNLGTSAIFTNNASGIVATNFDGTLNCNSASTVDTSNATAINIDGPVGLTSLGMTFVSVNSAGGTADGISIQDTNGSFAVVGDGTNTTAGGNATGGTISGKSGADGNNTQGIGIFLNNVTNITLRRIRVNGVNQNFGIRGLSVNNFTLEYSTVGSTTPTNSGTIAANLQGTSVSGIGEGAVYFGNQTDGQLGLTGTGTFTSNFISAGRYDNMQVSNGGGSLNRLNITGTTFGYNFVGTPQANAALTVVGRRPGSAGTTTLNSTVTGNTFVGSPGNAANFTGTEPTSTLLVAMDTIFQNNNISNNHANNNIGGSNLTIAGFSNTTFNASSNTMTGANGSAITLQMGAPIAGSTVATSFSGTLNNNTIGTAGVQNSGSATGNGIFLSLADNATAPKGQATIAITNNQIHGYHGNFGISADNTANTGGAYNVDLTITGNVTGTPSPTTSFGGIGLTAGAPPPSNNDIDVCAVVTGNDFSNGDPTNSNDMIVGGGSDANSTIRLPGLADTSLTGAANFLKNNNLNPATTAVNTYSDRTGGASPFIGGATCATPALVAGGGESGIAGNLDPIDPEPETLLPELETTPTNNVTSTPFVSAVTPSAGARARGTATTTTTAAPSTATADIPVTSGNPATTTALEPVINGAGGTVTVNIGTLAPGDSVTITFQVVIDNPYTGGPNISNQGTVSGSNFSNVLTDDPDVAGTNNPTLTPVNSALIQVNDAKQAEPTTGTAQMLFTVTVSSPAGAGGITVNYATANGGGNPATGGAACGGTTDYITASGTVTIPSGSRVATVPVDICADATSETDETLLLNISSPSAGNIIDPQATGTITAADAPGTVIISELRTRGSGGTSDDFVELYNNTGSPITVAASDASAGYGVYKMGADCNGTPVLLGTIPNGTVIPSRGHYLLVGSTYSLANYGGTGAAAGNLTMTSDIEDDHNVALFSTANIANISSANRLDAVGFGTNTGGICDLMREGSTLAPVGALNIEYSYFRRECDFASGVGCKASGNPKETNNNAEDFLFADTAMTNIAGITARLGAPGPENIASPIRRDDQGLLVLLVDGTKAQSAVPNRDRDFVNAGPNAPNGTLYIRRRIQNATGATVTRMRIRIIEMTTGPTPPATTADFRAVTSSPVVFSGIVDPATCASTGTPTTVPCQVTAQTTTLETPPTQPNGGGYNSSLSVNIPGGLAPNASINVNFALGVVQGGTFRFYIIVEALP